MTFGDPFEDSGVALPSGACWKGHPLSAPPDKFCESIKNHRVHPASNGQSHHADYIELLAQFTLFPQVRAGRADEVSVPFRF